MTVPEWKTRLVTTPMHPHGTGELRREAASSGPHVVPGPGNRPGRTFPRTTEHSERGSSRKGPTSSILEKNSWFFTSHLHLFIAFPSRELHNCPTGRAGPVRAAPVRSFRRWERAGDHSGKGWSVGAFARGLRSPSTHLALVLVGLMVMVSRSGHDSAAGSVLQHGASCHACQCAAATGDAEARDAMLVESGSIEPPGE